MGKKKHSKKASKVPVDRPTVISGTDVHFDYSDGAAGTEGKKNSKTKKKLHEKVTEAEIYDSEAEYPTSRVIKRAPNGDVIVESLPDAEKAPEVVDLQKSIPAKLDSHWESLNAEEKKTILRIEKNEVFEVIKNYQSSNNCNCSVCGRRSVAMEQELERIYNTLYENAKQTNSDTDFVLFHLNMIKELQRTNSTLDQSPTPKSPSPQYLENMRDEAVKYCLSNKAVESLKEEVLQFKHNKQKLQHQNTNLLEQSRHRAPHVAGNQENELQEQTQETLSHKPSEQEVNEQHSQHPHQTHQDLTTCNSQYSNQDLPKVESERFGQNDNTLDQRSVSLTSERSPESTSNEDLKDKYMNFAKTFVSSHPKIAQEYVNRMMMYPDMRALTEDLMNNNGQGFIKAMENFVLQKNDNQIEDIESEKRLTTTLQNGAPLTPEQYADLQRHLAEKMTTSFDVQTREFKNLHEIAGKRLLEQFLAGEDPVSKLMDSFVKQTNETNEALVAEDTHSSQFDYENEEDYDEEDYSEYDDEESEYDDEIYDDEDEDEDDTYHHHYHSHHHHQHDQDEGSADLDVEEDSTVGNEDEFDSGVDEQERLEEGRRLIQIAITKLLQKKLVDSYHEKQAENNRLRLLQELEAEEQKKKEKEEKKQRKREKEKEKKRLQQIAKEQERRKKEEEEARQQKEAEEREMLRREAQRKKVEEVKKKKDEERRRKLEEQRRREEEQQRQRKLKEEQKRKKEEEKKQREEEKKQKEEELKKQREQKKLERELKVQQDEIDRAKLVEKAHRKGAEHFNRRLSTPPEAVPYGNSNLSSGASSDLFNMVNEVASKSMSSSPSHLQALLQSQRQHAESQTYSTGTPLSVGTVSAQTVRPINDYGNVSYDSLVGRQQSMGSTWENSNNLFHAPPNLEQSYPERQGQATMPSVSTTQTYAPFNTSIDSNNSFANELNNLTNLLSSSNLNGGHVPSGADSSFFKDNLWSNLDPAAQATPSNFIPPNPTTFSASSVANTTTSHRKSIWDSGASLNSLGMNSNVPDYRPDIWTSPNTSSQVTRTPAVDNKVDAILQSYSLLSRELGTDFVPAEKLYQAAFSCAADSPAFSYATFVGALLNMRSTHNCDLLMNQVGTITHARFSFGGANSQQLSYQQGQQATSACPPQIPQGTSVSGNPLFKELYNTSNTVASPSLALANPGVSNESNSNLFDFDQQFGQPRTSNIWG
ncbi:LAFE_0E12992g1_1 [Lachancea fermentati]|uniref:Stress response protein NST1 n=1 Tax=Lachancea fermentati TaxID=4955 RepID=A0A1G4MDW8_LACFM|nr:LAFE_0E12992g1_1 [Lachancea fermentati]